MNLAVKRMIKVMYFIIVVSSGVAISSIVIFVFDINGSKGLIPVIFFSLMVYFLLLFSMNILKQSFNTKNKKLSIKKSDLILGIISCVFFFLSLYVFWL